MLSSIRKFVCSSTDKSQFFLSSFPTVVPLPDEPQQAPATLPTLPDKYSSVQPNEDILVALIATVTALSLVASVGLIVILR